MGSNRTKTEFRLLKLDRTDPISLHVTEDSTVYSRTQIKELLTMIDEGNKSYGGLKKTCSAYGIIGFVRFLAGYYLLLITRRRKVGDIMGHNIYAIDDTAYLYIPHPSVKSPNIETTDEARYKSLFFGTDLTKDFYFSYSYDLSNTFQYNISTSLHSNSSSASNNNQNKSKIYSEAPKPTYSSMYIWNHFLMRQFVKKTSTSMESKENGKSSKIGEENSKIIEIEGSYWIVPLLHGFFSQTKFSIYGKMISIVVIARRSRFYAGTRFLKRGINERGQVGNHVESEQIVFRCDAPVYTIVSTPSSIPSNSSTASKVSGNNSSTHYTSFVQVRGSIPLYWYLTFLLMINKVRSQDNSIMAPKPPIICM